MDHRTADRGFDDQVVLNFFGLFQFVNLLFTNTPPEESLAGGFHQVFSALDGFRHLTGRSHF